MIHNNMSGLILEGVSGAGKTTILKAILNSEAYRERAALSSVILTEHQTQRILERKQREGDLTKADNLDLLDDHINYLEKLSGRLESMEWCRKNQARHRVPFLLERFHLTHVLHYGYMSWEDVDRFDLRLESLNGHLCVLTATEKELGERLFDSRDENWNNYIRRFGSTRKEILNHFVNQQNELLELADLSRMEVMIYNPASLSLEEGSEKILDFWSLS